MLDMIGIEVEQEIVNNARHYVELLGMTMQEVIETLLIDFQKELAPLDEEDRVEVVNTAYYNCKLDLEEELDRQRNEHDTWDSEIIRDLCCRQDFLYD